MRKTGTLIWREIAGKIQDDIVAKILSSDERLPNEARLAERYEVNRHTLRHAVGYLAEQGVLEVRHGKGTFVKKASLNYPLTTRTRFTETISKQNQHAEGRLFRCERLKYDDAAAALRLEADNEFILLEIVHSANGAPLTLCEHYLPLPRFAGIDSEFIRTSSITASLRAFDVIDYKRGSTRLHARLPTSREALRLKQSRSQPIVSMRYVNYDIQGRPVEFCISRFSAERVQFIFTPEPES